MGLRFLQVQVISSILPPAASLVVLVFQHEHVELFMYLVSVMFFVFVVIKTVVENYVHLDVWRTVSILVEAPSAFNLMSISDLRCLVNFGNRRWWVPEITLIDWSCFAMIIISCFAMDNYL